jgi:hypothetical protein
MKDYSV